MARKWRDIRKQGSAESEAEIKKWVAGESARINASLAQVRKAREYTQAELAQALKIEQGEVSKVEHRADVYVSTLRKYIEALGGNLEIRAVFPDAEIVITQFEDLDAGNQKHEERYAIPA